MPLVGPRTLARRPLGASPLSPPCTPEWASRPVILLNLLRQCGHCRLAGIEKKDRTLCVYKVWKVFGRYVTILAWDSKICACPAHATVADQWVLGMPVSVINWAEVILIDPVGQHIEL